jgi:hypothetical protein
VISDLGKISFIMFVVHVAGEAVAVAVTLVEGEGVSDVQG